METIRIPYEKVKFTKWAEEVDEEEGRMTDMLVLARDCIIQLNPDITKVEFVDFWNKKVLYTFEKKGRSIVAWKEDGYAKLYPA